MLEDRPKACEMCHIYGDTHAVLMPINVYMLCGACEARMSILQRDYPLKIEKFLRGDRDSTKLPLIEDWRIRDEIMSIRRQRAGQPKTCEPIVNLRRLLLQRQSARDSKDTTPWHPVPKLGEPVEPQFYPQFAHDPVACQLSPRDRIELHGLGVCWKQNDVDLLPKPKPEDGSEIDQRKPR